MIELFGIGENKGGFFVYPTNNPSDFERVAGDEVDRDRATVLCDSLNSAVNDYVAQRMEQSQRIMYSVLGGMADWMLDGSGKHLEEFITQGMREDLREAAKAGSRRPLIRSAPTEKCITDTIRAIADSD